MKQLTEIQKHNIRLTVSIFISFFIIMGVLSLIHGCGGTVPAVHTPTSAEQRQTRREAKCAELEADVDDLRQWCISPASTPVETHRRATVCRTVSEYDRTCGRNPQQ